MNLPQTTGGTSFLSDSRPDPADVDAWCREYATSRDPALRRLIVERHDWLVQICARQMRRRDEPLDDLVQTGQVALLLALERFDPRYEVAFRTFASATILGELRRHYRSSWRVRVPRRLQELHLAVSAAVEQLTTQLGRSPQVDDIAELLRVPREAVVEAIAAGLSYWPAALSTTGDGTDGVPVPGFDDGAFADVDARDEVKVLLDRLPGRERAIVYLRFFHDMTQSEIAERLGLSQVHVSRLLRKALSSLRS